MRNIEEVKKLKAGYRVTFDNEEVVQIELDIYFKFHLKAGLSLDQKTYQKMIAENNELYYMKLGILRLKKMQTEKELYLYLLEKGCSKNLALKLLSYYKDRKYINDETYVSQYVEFKKHQQGPKMMKASLEKKGVDGEIIDQYLKNINQDQVLEHLIAKKLSSSKNKTKKQALLSIKTYFIQKGFDRHLVDAILEKQALKFSFNEKELLNKAFDKLYKKYKDKKTGYELKSFIKQKLYQKGFNLEDIENIYIDKDVLS